MSRSRNRGHHGEHGFTLLEILVALAIVAIALGAIIVNGGNAAGAAGSLRDKSIALWVAHNRMAELELAPVWPKSGKSNDDITMGGITWTWRVTVQTTPDPTLRRIDIDIDKKDQPKAGHFASLSGFISNVGRQVQQ
jgi:general secretion pathway protein I